MSILKEFHYDLHIHSCLSPCGDSGMTPCNIVGMAKLKGLDVIAVTDHNSCLNCAAVMEAGARCGLLVLPGMELCTCEDIHVICLFSTIGDALDFSKKIHAQLPNIQNQPRIFGDQTVIDSNDVLTGEENLFLLSAATIRFDFVVREVALFGGVAFPAHVDKPSNGVLAILGTFPPDTGFTAIELSSNCDKTHFLAQHSEFTDFPILSNSDAHYLGDMSERGNFFLLPELSPHTILEFLSTSKNKRLIK